MRRLYRAWHVRIFPACFQFLSSNPIVPRQHFTISLFNQHVIVICLHPVFLVTVRYLTVVFFVRSFLQTGPSSRNECRWRRRVGSSAWCWRWLSYCWCSSSCASSSATAAENTPSTNARPSTGARTSAMTRPASTNIHSRTHDELCS